MVIMGGSTFMGSFAEDDEDIDHEVTSSRRGARISGQSTPIYLEGRRVHSPRKLVRVRAPRATVSARTSGANLGTKPGSPLLLLDERVLMNWQ